MSKNKKHSKTNRRWVLILVSAVIVLGGAVTGFVLVHNHQAEQARIQAQKIADQQKAEKEKAEQARSNAIFQQNLCLGNAYQDYKKAFDAADTNGDGQVAYKDGWLSIQTNYYDAEISCYQTWKTDDSASKIADTQQKRQQDTNTYNAWLGSLQQNNSYSQPTHCTSYTYGINNQFTSYNCY